MEAERERNSHEASAHGAQDQQAAQVRKDNAAFLDTDFDVHAGYAQQLQDQRLLALTKLQSLFAARQLGVARK